MKRFAVSWINWTDNDLKTEFVKAESELAALQAKLAKDGLDEVPDTIEGCKQLAFDCDGMIHAAEVPDNHGETNER